MITQGQVGPQSSTTSLSSGTQPASRFGNMGDQIVSELHGRFYEQNYRGGLYSFGLSNTVLAAANAIVTAVDATAKPVVGVWNPLTSGMNLVLLQAIVALTTVAGTAVSPGGFMWLGSANNGAVTTGSTPLNNKTLTASGSVAKAFAISTALTGMTNSLTVLRASSLTSINAAGPATAISQMQGVSVENIDGSLIVPPGGVVALMNQVSTTTVNLSVGLFWEEVPV